MFLYLPPLTEVDSFGHERSASVDKTIASFLISIEKERKKGTGFLLKQPREKISYIVQVLWPFIVLKQPSGKWVAFDSLSILKKTFICHNHKSSEEFSTKIANSTPTHASRTDFHNFLSSHGVSFRDFTDTISFDIPGGISNKEMRQELEGYFQLAIVQEYFESLPLQPIINKQKTRESLEKLLELRKKSIKTMKELQAAKANLQSIVDKWDAEIDKDKQWNNNYYYSKIDEIRPDVEEQIRTLEEERDCEVSPLETVVGSFQRDIAHIEEIEAIHEAHERDAYLELEQAREQLEIARNREYECGDAASEISFFERKIQHASEKVATYGEMKQQSANRKYVVQRELLDKQEELDSAIRYYNGLVSEQKSRITVLEGLRAEEIAKLDAESNKMFERSNGIQQDIDNLVNRKALFVQDIDEIEGPVANINFKPDEENYVYVPIFVAKLESEAGSRFLVYPPCRLKKGKSVTEKFLFFKMAVPAEARSQNFERLSANMESLLLQNHPVAREIFGKTHQSNLLRSSRVKDNFYRGLEKLRGEGRLKDKHSQELADAFSEHFSNSPTKVQKTDSSIPPEIKHVCPKCGSNICMEIDHCPVCGSKW